MIRTNKKDEDMKSGDRRRGLYTFAYEQEAEAWDALFPTRSEISKLIKRNANAGEFINAKALIALSDKRTGNFIHPIFVNMLEQRLTELGYTIVDEAFKLGAPQREVMQHVNYYYDTVAIQIEQFKQSEIEFYKNRYGLEEKVEKESVNYVDEETKECYNFVDSSLTRFYDANKRKPSTQSEGPSMQ